MNCDICLKNFDQSLNKPIVLLNCAHTICSLCLFNLLDRKCPTCGDLIEDTVPNWFILRKVTESEYDKLKSIVFKTLLELSSYEKRIAEIVTQKNEETNDLVKSVKIQVENQANEIIKHLNQSKNEILFDIETNGKRIAKCLADLAQINQIERINELKEKLLNNNLTKEELLNLKNNLIDQKDQLKNKLESINGYSETFEFVSSDKNITKKNLLGKIFTKQKNEISSNPASTFQPEVIKIIRTKNNLIAIMNLNTAEIIKEFKDDINHVNCVQVLDPKTLFTCSSDYNSGVQKITKWHIETGQILQTFKGHLDTSNDSLQGVMWIEIISNNRLASCGWDKTIRIWDITTGECLKVLKDHTNGVYRVKALFSNENQLISCSEDTTLKLWQIDSEKCLKTFSGHLKAIRCIDVILLLNKITIVSGSEDNTVKVWNLDRNDCVHTLKGHCHFVVCIQALANNEQIVSGSEDSTIRLWCLKAFTALKVFKGHGMVVWTLKVLPNDHLISGSDDGTMKIWDLNSGRCVKTIDESNNFIQIL